MLGKKSTLELVFTLIYFVFRREDEPSHFFILSIFNLWRPTLSLPPHKRSVSTDK